MKSWIRLQGMLLACMVLSATTFAQAPQPGTLPENAAPIGFEIQNNDLAVIESSCGDFDQALLLRDALVRNGAVVSIITSPGRMLAWVPAENRDAVRNTRLDGAADGIRVLSLSYSAAEFETNRSQNQTMAAENDADRAIVEYLDFIKRPLTEEEKLAIREREMEIAARMETEPPMDCMDVAVTDMPSPRQLNTGIPALDVTEDELLRRTKVRGFIVHTSFFVESKSGTGTWNWDPVIYARYRNFYIAGMNYWSSFVARYGKSLTTHWRLYSPYSSATQVNGEPTTIGEEAYIPQCIIKVAMPTVFDFPPAWDFTGPALEWAWWYNKRIRNAFNSDEAICGFICYKPTYNEAVWPHARSVIWGGSDIEGVYFTMDTQYWQAELDPFSAPQRNVVAHEIGHLWGCPDEYKDDNCNWSYRGIRNVNCQKTTTAYGRPGFSMKGWDGMMKGNYLNGNSVAQPVHSGVISASQTAPIRCFTSAPTGIQLSFKNCDNAGNVNRTTPTCIPMDYYYCHRVVAPTKVFKSGDYWYFDHWEISRETGPTVNIDYYGAELPSYAVSSSWNNAVRTVRAVYTNSPPDIFTNNTSLEAALAPASAAATPDPAIALRWRTKYNMIDADTYVQYEASAGNWKQLTGQHYTLAPFRVDAGEWTGVHIWRVPNASGSGSTNIQSNRTYKFRIIGEFNGNPGTPSSPASVTTRPSTPQDTIYCHDPNEPNSLGSPKTLSSSGPGMTPYTVEGAVPIIPRSGEWSWFIPSPDYYRITVINVSGMVFGERVTLTLRVKDGSNFRPRFRAQRVGTTTHINSVLNGGVYRLNLTADGEYLIKVESNISQTISYDLVDRSSGHFGFGEYEIRVERSTTNPGFQTPCVNCVKMKLVHPFPGEIIMKPHPRFALFSTGVSRSVDSFFDVFYMIPPGYSFQGFGGDFGNLTQNPAPIRINQNTEAGVYSIYPIIEPISPGMAELVVINPEGPDGPPTANQAAILGENVLAEAKAPEGHVFVGWGGDTTGTTNPMPVTLWRNKKLIAYYRPKPCVPEPMSEWRHVLTFRNARQNEVALDYAMQPGAGDGLEAGQTDLPPIPPPTAFDIRWINIAGSQGSTTDHRAIKSEHTFQGRVQTGPTHPVELTWGALPASPNASFVLRIQGVPGSINMRESSSFSFKDQGTYIFTIEVKEAACPEPTEENDVIVTTEDVNNDEWPCVSIKLRIRDRNTGDPLPYYNPYYLKIFERNDTGELVPTRIREFIQRDSSLIARLCPDPKDPNRDREIVVVNDNENDDQKKDTTTVRVTPPVPDGDGDPVRFVFKTDGDWQMVSTPLALKDADVTELFVDPNLRLYEFNTTSGAYDAAEKMEHGIGYWMKAGPLEQVLIGLAKPELVWNSLSGIGEPYGYGWNMIGSLASAVNVSSIQQNPSGGLKSIFGWDPGQGYIVPTQIEPAKGYWVRVDPSTTLRIATSGIRGSGSQTGYSKVVSSMDLAGLITVEDADANTRLLYVSATDLTDADRDQLVLPAAPPSNVLDVRTGDGSQFLFAGENIVHIRGSGRHALTVPVSSDRMAIEVYDEQDRLLHRFDGTAGDHLLVDVTGTRTLKLTASVRPAATDITLGSNYPNPFRIASRTVIPYTLVQDGMVRLTVYDMLGRVVRDLVAEHQAAGSKVAEWNGRDQAGAPVPAGVYNYRLETKAGVVSRTLTIVK